MSKAEMADTVGTPAVRGAPEAAPAITRREVAVLAALALASSVVAIQFSYDVGKLAFFPFYDDSTYLIEAQRRVAAIQEEGLRAWRRALTTFADPYRERSGFMINLAVLAFLVFGRTAAWAPYLALTTFVLGVLVLLRVLFRAYSFRAFVAATVALLCVPVARGWTIEFRPDITWGFAIGLAVLFVLRDLHRYPVRIGLGAAVATLFKPSALLASLAIGGVAVALALVRRRRSGEGPSLRHAGRLAAGFALGLVALGFFTLPGSVRYTYNVLFVAPEPWIRRGDLAFTLGYYVTGAGGRWAFGRTSGLLLVFVLAAAGWAALRDRAALALMARAGVVAACAYAIITVTPVKGVLLGSAFYALAGLLFFHAVLVLAEAGERAAGGQRALRILPAVVLAGAALWRVAPGPHLPEHGFLERGSPGHRVVEEVNRETYRVFAEAEDRAGAKAPLAMGIVSFGPAVSEHLGYHALLDRRRFTVEDLYGVGEEALRDRLPGLCCVAISDTSLEWIQFARRDNARIVASLRDDAGLELRYRRTAREGDSPRGDYYVFCRR